MATEPDPDDIAALCEEQRLRALLTAHSKQCKCNNAAVAAGATVAGGAVGAAVAPPAAVGILGGLGFGSGGVVAVMYTHST